MKATRVLLLLAAALVATATLPTTTAHEHHEHHDHRNHHDHREHQDHDHHDSAPVHKRHDHHDHGVHAHAHHEHHDHGAHAHDHHDHAHASLPKSATAAIDRFSPSVWAEALFATALVGAAPVVVLFFVPLGLGNTEAQKPLLRVFLSFAAGGLLGDALLHLLPHSLPAGGHDPHDHGHGHGHDHGHDGHAHSVHDLAVWLYCIAGMMTFLMLEKFVRAQTGGSDGHGHSHGPAPKRTPEADDANKTVGSEGLRRRTVGQAKKDTAEEEDEEETKSKEPKRIAAAGYLNLAADFSHNFTDGLAIGATFLRGSGWQTTVAMLLHEVPHEIGDFAILIQSGFTRREAMMTQLATALGAMAGTVLGLLIEGAGDSGSAWISPFTAGGFIYIACASVMPELLEDCSLAQSLKEGVAMCLGIGLMVVIALNE